MTTFGQVVGVTDENRIAEDLTDGAADTELTQKTKLRLPGRAEARRLIARAVSRVVDFDVTDVLADAWDDHAKLAASGVRTGDGNGGVVHDLSPQDLSWRRHVTIDVTFEGLLIHQVALALTATAELREMTATVADGRLTRISSGDADLACELTADGVKLGEGSTHVDLALDVELGAGIDLGAST
ncbi:MAG TPA: hypothetical protein VJM33_16190 [Microthrixaceae bacterium]|nr:hypothetical protein [Microthrixaceae bacterium]